MENKLATCCIIYEQQVWKKKGKIRIFLPYLNLPLQWLDIVNNLIQHYSLASDLQKSINLNNVNFNIILNSADSPSYWTS